MYEPLPSPRQSHSQNDPKTLPGPRPRSVAASTVAPAEISCSTTAAWPFSAATCSTVLPRHRGCDAEGRAAVAAVEKQSNAGTPKWRYFHFRHLMKILLVVWTYHRTDFYLFSLVFTYFFIYFWRFRRDHRRRIFLSYILKNRFGQKKNFGIMSIFSLSGGFLFSFILSYFRWQNFIILFFSFFIQFIFIFVYIYIYIHVYFWFFVIIWIFWNFWFFWIFYIFWIFWFSNFSEFSEFFEFSEFSEFSKFSEFSEFSGGGRIFEFSEFSERARIFWIIYI